MKRTKQFLLSLLTLLCCCTGAWATGELNGLFTINASGDKVQFSQGNLQYFCSTSAPEWRFAEHQYDYVSFDISAYAANSEKWIDLFAHGTSGYNNGQANYQPYVVGAASNTYYQGNLTGNADWGYNAISNGGNTENIGWRTLTRDEWLYVFSGRSNAASKYGHGSINGTNGMILLPDNWTLPDGLNFTSGNSAWTNSYTLEQWALMENAGALFLPASGSCNKDGIPLESAQNQNGFYRASTAAYYMHFTQSTLENCTMSFFQYGDAVRLVKDYQLQQDGEGNYLLGSAYDWKLFATLVNGGNTTANAKMTADIDLGDDQTKIGIAESKPYSGTFDGQGHTLTINYTSDNTLNAPFPDINNATIKNIHITGTIQSSDSQPAAIGLSRGTSTIENLWSSLNITGTPNGSKWKETSGIVGLVISGNLTMNDCIFTGTNSSSGDYNGCFVGYIDSGSATITSCLSVGEFNYLGSGSGFRGTHTNCYVKQFPASYPAGVTQTTDETLADGTIAYTLQNHRGELVWGQRIGIDAEPVLTNDENYRVYRSKSGGYTNNPEEAYEEIQRDGEGNYLIGSVLNWQDFADLVQTTPTANAKMTADIDLGTQITMIASDFDHPYQGTFDGQGHTLTVNWTTNGEDRIAPFRYAEGATIKRLHVDGSISKTDAYGRCPAGILACSIGSATTTITECWSSVSLYAFDTIGGLFSVALGNSTTNIVDCVFSGMISASNSTGCSGGFASHADTEYVYTTKGAPTVNITRGLNLGTFTGANPYLSYTFIRMGNPVFGTHTINNCYYKNVYGNAQGTQATSANLADGTITAALQNGRAEDVWVQDPMTNQPMLKMFATKAYTVPSSGIGTFSAKAKFAVPDGLTAHYCKTYDSEKGTISVVAIEGAVPANTGVLLKGEPGETYTLTGTNDDAATVTDNALVAVTEATHVEPTSGDYTNFMMSGGKFIKIASSAADVKMPANRAYLKILTSAFSGNEARDIVLSWDEDEPTEISEVRGKKEDVRGEIYNLSGQRVSKPTKGLYIIGGKKVFIY